MATGTGTRAVTHVRPRPVARWLGGALLAEAITLGLASWLHRDNSLSLGFATLHGEHFPGAATPEAVIAAVLAIGALVVLTAPARARRVALAAAAFAILGTAIGIVAVVTSTRPSITGDLTCHASLMAALLITLALLIRSGRAVR
jgi:voltage-gated potassium channel Kch